QKLAQRQGWTCPVCGDDLLNGEELHRHHRQQRRGGGTGGPANLGVLALFCPLQKHLRGPEPPAGLCAARDVWGVERKSGARGGGQEGAAAARGPPYSAPAQATTVFITTRLARRSGPPQRSAPRTATPPPFA